MKPAISSHENTAANFFDHRRVSRMAETHRLEHAPDSMAEMHPDKNHRDDVEEGDRDDSEAIDEVVICIERDELRMNGTGSQMEKVKNDKCKR